jgi:hypothetical protein
MQASPRYKEIAGRSKKDLEEMLKTGEMPSVESLLGFEYRGFNYPPLFKLIGMRKFIKYFFRSEGGETFGCNTPVQQNTLDEEWHARPDDEHPKRYGFYKVGPVDPESRDHRYPQALMLNYGRGGNPPLDPQSVIRDYLVRVEPGSDELLLGKAYVAVGPARVFSNFFLLERHRAAGIPVELAKR